MQAKISPRHRAALEYAAAGIPIFPCTVGGKKPATARGFHDATTDEAQINQWWNAADYNLAFSPEEAGWAVIDLDPKSEGPQNWSASPGAEDTYTVETPSGGRHLYFVGSLPSSASRIAPGIDTRGVGGYVLAPPSIVDGKLYRVIDDREVEPIPDWIGAAFKKSEKAEAPPPAALDAPFDVRRARALLEKYARDGNVATEGAGGDTKTYTIAAEVSNLGVSKEVACDLFEEIWNPACIPPWDRADIVRLVANGYAYAQNSPGVWAVAPASVSFRGALDKLSAAEPASRPRFYFEDEDEQEEGPDPEWLIPEIMQEDTINILSAVSKSYKSFMALSWALSIASGTPTFTGMPTRTGPVFYGSSEGRNSLKKARRRAWKMANGVTKKIPFYVGKPPIVSRPEDVQEFGEAISAKCGGRRPGLIVIDTASNAIAGWNENDSSDVAKFVEVLKSYQVAFNCPVLVVHHESHRPGAAKGSRGASNWFADFDTASRMEPHHDEYGKKISKMVLFDVLKHRDADEPENPWYFEGVKMGPAMVLQKVTESEYLAVVKGKNVAAPKGVGGALKDLGAIGPGNAVSTTVLAEVLTPKQENQSLEEAHAAQQETRRKLSKAAGSALQGYATKVGSEWTWCLPG